MGDGSWSGEILGAMGLIAVQLSIGIVVVSVVRVLWGRMIGRQWMTVLWWVVMVRALVPFSIETGLWEIARPAASAVLAQASPPVPVESINGTALDTPPRSLPVETAVATAQTAAPIEVAPWRPGLGEGIVFAWLAVAVALAAMRLAAYRRTVRHILRGAKMAPPAWHGVVETVRGRMGVRTWPVLLVSPDVSAPMLMGAFRPKIVVPVTWSDSLAEDDLRYFLLHEMAHLRRGDIWFGWGWFVAQTLHWFNPLMWWAGRCVRLDRELACDEAVLQSGPGSDGQAYGRALLEALKRQSGRSRNAPALGWAGVAEDRRFMERRIEMIRDFEKAGWRGKLASATAVCTVLAVSYCQVWAFGAAAPESAGGEADVTSPFAEISDESTLSDAKEAAINNGDLIRACEAEMRRVKVRDAEENVWKDKIDLAGIALGFEANGKPADDAERAAMIADLTAYAQAHSGDKDYGWRVWQLCAGLSKGDAEAQIEYLRMAIAAYPFVAYAQPSKHSKFQHLVNELAVRLWDAQGQQAAEDFVVETWKRDGRFQFFFEPVLAEKYERAGAAPGAFAALKQRMGEKPPKRELVLELTPEGMTLDGKVVTIEELAAALDTIEQPMNCIATVKPDAKLPVERLVEVVDLLRLKGIAKVGIGVLSAE